MAREMGKCLSREAKHLSWGWTRLGYGQGSCYSIRYNVNRARGGCGALGMPSCCLDGGEQDEGEWCSTEGARTTEQCGVGGAGLEAGCAEATRRLLRIGDKTINKHNSSMYVCAGWASNQPMGGGTKRK